MDITLIDVIVKVKVGFYRKVRARKERSFAGRYLSLFPRRRVTDIVKSRGQTGASPQS